MLARLLAIVSVACCLLTALSFALFARDQFAGASLTSQRELDADAGQGVIPLPRGHRSTLRRWVDGATARLESPFATLLHTHSAWMARSVETALALLLYGFGLGFLARYSQGSSRVRRR